LRRSIAVVLDGKVDSELAIVLKEEPHRNQFRDEMISYCTTHLDSRRHFPLTRAVFIASPLGGCCSTPNIRLPQPVRVNSEDESPAVLIIKSTVVRFNAI
jgi:hypothetical protein